MLSLSIFDLVLTGLSEISRKILNVNDMFDENANFGHFRLFLACFLPVFSNLQFRHMPVNCVFTSVLVTFA